MELAKHRTGRGRAALFGGDRVFDREVRPTMSVDGKFTALVTEQREPRENFRTLISSVLPRPIALVSTVSKGGVNNLAPFSFFNAVGSNPPAIMFSPCTKADGTSKDTIVNLREVGEFVVNVVPYAIRNPMNDSSFPFGPEVDEFDAAGFTPLESSFVRPPRVRESPVQMECKLARIVPVGDGPLSANICIGEILCFHVADGVLMPDGSVSIDEIDLVGRLGGEDYSTIRDRFALSKPARPARFEG